MLLTNSGLTKMKFKYKIGDHVCRNFGNTFSPESSSERLVVLARSYNEDFSGGSWNSYRCHVLSGEMNNGHDVWLTEALLEFKQTNE